MAATAAQPRVARLLGHLSANPASASSLSQSAGSIRSLGSIKVLSVSSHDVRFPTSEGLHGSDSMHPDPDYSATYVQVHTNYPELVGTTFHLTSEEL
jgi:hypothetical protein